MYIGTRLILRELCHVINVIRSIYNCDTTLLFYDTSSIQWLGEQRFRQYFSKY